MRPGRLNVQRIQTPEGITFSLPLAGVGRRAIAWVIDVVLVVCLCVFITIALSVSGVMFWFMARIGGLTGGLLAALFALLGISYRVILEWYWRGQTVGKKMMGLRVMDEYGLQMQFSQIVIRNVLRIFDFLPGLNIIGGVSIFWTKNNQRLGDLAGSTIVVMVSRQAQPDLDQLLTGKYNSFRDHPHLAARLRQRVTPREAQLALEALLRRDQLEPEARTEVFREYAEHFREKVRFPEDVLLGLSDEKFVQNTVDIVYRARAEQGTTEPVAATPSPSVGA